MRGGEVFDTKHLRSVLGVGAMERIGNQDRRESVGSGQEDRRKGPEGSLNPIR